MRYSFVAEGVDWETLKADVQDVVKALYYDTPKPEPIALHMLHEEDLKVA